MIPNELSERMGYDNLLAGILRQTIQDYVLAKRCLLKGKKATDRYNVMNRLKSCERFFENPPYDYGDIDFVLVKRLCDEKAVEGGRVFYREYNRDEWRLQEKSL